MRTRGLDCDLHRRVHDEGSAIFRKYDDMFPGDGSQPRNPHLFSVFLSSRQRIDNDRPSLGFAIDLAVRVPEYQIERRLWLDNYYKGSTILYHTIYVEATPPQDGGEWEIKYGVDPAKIGDVPETAVLIKTGDGLKFSIPVNSGTTPGLRGQLWMVARAWK